MNDYLQRALDKLRELQYQYSPPDDYYHTSAGYFCPECGTLYARPHVKGCELGDLIKDLEEQLHGSLERD